MWRAQQREFGPEPPGYVQSPGAPSYGSVSLRTPGLAPRQPPDHLPPAQAPLPPHSLGLCGLRLRRGSANHFASPATPMEHPLHPVGEGALGQSSTAWATPFLAHACLSGCAKQPPSPPHTHTPSEPFVAPKAGLEALPPELQRGGGGAAPHRSSGSWKRGLFPPLGTLLGVPPSHTQDPFRDTGGLPAASLHLTAPPGHGQKPRLATPGRSSKPTQLQSLSVAVQIHRCHACGHGGLPILSSHWRDF